MYVYTDERAKEQLTMPAVVLDFVGIKEILHVWWPALITLPSYHSLGVGWG